LVFDGANIWVASYDGGTLSKMRVSDGVLLDVYNIPGPMDSHSMVPISG